MTVRTGLYYPFIHFQDDEWVKLAAMYWARMGRIVPPGYATRDSSVVKALGDAFVHDLSPTLAASALNERFVTALTAHADTLRNKYGVDASHAWQEDPVTRQRTEGLRVPLEDREKGFAFLHAGKLSPVLRDKLVDAGLAVPTRGGDESWIGVHPRVSRVYMTALADQLASGGSPSQRHLFPVTDDAFDHVAVGSWTTERLSAALLEEPSLAQNAHEEIDPGVALAFVAIETAVPNDLSSVPVERIVEVREKYGAELTQFVGLIEGMRNELEDLKDVRDPQVLRLALQARYDKTIKPELERLQHDLELFDIATVKSAATIKVTVPSALTTGAGVVGATINPILAGGAGIALALTHLISERRLRAAESMRDTNAAYLFRLDEGLTPKTLIEHIGQRIRRFVTGT